MRNRIGTNVLVAVLPVILLALSASGANASAVRGSNGNGSGSGTVLIPAPASIPDPPSLSAPLSEWQTWSADQVQGMEGFDWAAAAQSVGCVLDSVAFQTSNSSDTPDAEEPPGITTVAVTLVTTCSGSTSTSEQALPLNVPVGGACGSVQGPGQQCIDPDIQGGQEYVEAKYTYQGISSMTGHLEISSDGANAQSCSVGSLFKNGNKVTLGNGQAATLINGPVNYSTVWNGNFWEGTGNPYTNLGNVCSAF
jgi:hypothetical protein